ncbi:iron-sulfur cluster repair di-iron protein [soil metagenome]
MNIAERRPNFYLYPSMEKTGLRSRRIADLVEQDNVRAYVLYYFGIRFYEYSEKTLEEVCHLRGLKLEQVVKQLESPTHALSEESIPLLSYPIDLIIEYLKHAHFLFVKRKLPYISRLVESFNADHESYESIARDLKTLFPLFVEDFVHHIFEEEATLFRYIRFLDKVEKGKHTPSKLFYMMERHSLQRFAMEHEVHDDEMEGIRKITQDYRADATTPLHVRVIYSELTALEKSLQVHARIENEILFPKAMMLENKIKTAFQEKVKFN